MKKYLGLLLTLSLIVVLVSTTFSGYRAMAVTPTDGTGSETSADIGKITCVTKSRNEVAPGSFFTIRYTIETNKRFYVVGTPSLYPYGASDDSSEIHPQAAYVQGSGTNSLFFFYKTTPGDGVLPSSSDLTSNPMIGVNTDSGHIYTLNSAGTQYFSMDLSALNDTTLPKCGNTPPPLPTCPPGTTGTWPNCTTVSSGSGSGSGGSSGGSIPDTGNCTDGIKNGNETGIDTGGSCEGGITGPDTAYIPTIEHIPSNVRPILVNWVNVTLPAFLLPNVDQARKDWNKVRALLITVDGAGWTVPMYYGEYPGEQWIGAESYSGFYGDPHQYNPKVEFNKTKIDSLGLANSNDYMQFLVCHELGHALGMGHSDVDNNNNNLGGCMDYSRHPGPNTGAGPKDNTHPSTSEVRALEQLYNHTD